MKNKALSLLRVVIGFVYLWAFLDKLFGLGFATCRGTDGGGFVLMCEKAWLSGGSPTFGFLKFASRGPLAGFYQSLAGNPFIDWLFMLGLLGVGTALIFGILTRLAVFSGVLMMLLMYSSLLLPENNPLIDEHIIYSLILLSFLSVPSEDWLGFSRGWKRLTKNIFWLN